MKTIKSIIVKISAILFMVTIVSSTFFLSSCHKFKYNIEVMAIDDFVHYVDRTEIVENNPYAYKIGWIWFHNTDYVAKNSTSNDYYIIDGDRHISPLDLEVGDKLYLENMVAPRIERAPAEYSGGYLYLCN